MSDRLPGVIASVTTNQALVSGIASIRTPIILGAGDVKVLVENEKVLKGSSGSDTLSQTIYAGTLTANEYLANVVRIGDTPNSSDYAKTTTFTASGNQITWVSGAPSTGAEYYITYYKSISNFILTEYSAESDVKSAHGDIVFSATKQFATATVGSTGGNTLAWNNQETINTPYTNWSIQFVSGSNAGISRTVSNYSTGTFTFSTAFPSAISVGDIFLIQNSSPMVNMLTTGTLLALRNGAQSAIVGQLSNASFSDKLAPSASEYGTALATHLESLKSIAEQPYFIVPMLPDNTTTFTLNSSAQTNAINLVWNHCKLMSTPENKGERTCIAGFLSTTTEADFKGFGPAYFSQRMVVIAPGDLRFNEVSSKTLNGSIGAAAWAGKYCSRSDFRSMLNESLTGVSVASTFYNPIQQRSLTGKGISFLVADAGVVRIIASKTTDTSTADTEDVAVVSIADHIKKVTREDLGRTFIGQAITSRLVGAMGAKLSSLFEGMINSQVITAYKDIKVRQSLAAPRLIEVSAQVSPQYSLWWVSLDFSFYV